MIHCKLKEDAFYRVTLLAILFLGFASAFFASYDKSLQTMIVILTAMIYVGWGILHHYTHHDITAKIVLEYIVIGSLGIAIVFFVLRSTGGV